MFYYGDFGVSFQVALCCLLSFFSVKTAYPFLSEHVGRVVGKSVYPFGHGLDAVLRNAVGPKETHKTAVLHYAVVIIRFAHIAYGGVGDGIELIVSGEIFFEISAGKSREGGGRNCR